MVTALPALSLQPRLRLLLQRAPWLTYQAIFEGPFYYDFSCTFIYGQILMPWLLQIYGRARPEKFVILFPVVDVIKLFGKIRN